MGKRIVIDTSVVANLLCVYDDVGAFDPARGYRIIQDKTHRTFYTEFGELLFKILAKNFVVVASHVFAEVSNIVKREFRLSETLNGRNPMAALLRSERCFENNVSLANLLAHAMVSRKIDLGITDCVLMALSGDADYLLSEDEDLIKASREIGLEAMTPMTMISGLS